MDSNKQGFPHAVGGIFRICFFGEGLESIHGRSMGSFIMFFPEVIVISYSYS